MPKHELNNLYHLNKEINELLEEIMKEETKAQKITGTLSDMPRGNETSDKVGNGASKISDLKEQLDRAKDKAEIERGEILKKIYELNDSRYRRILRERYVNLKSFEEISVLLGYSYRQTIRLHGEALLIYKKMA